MSPTAARVTWLLSEPEKREAYAVQRFTPLATGRFPIFGPWPCLRCGALVTMQGTGQRAGLLVSVRDRGTDWRNKEELAIHRGCVPKPGEEPQRVRARRLPAKGA